MAKKTADVTLSEAQTELVNINARLSDASARRDKLLQFFGDDKSLDAVEAEITVLRRQHERQAARVKLFEQQVEQAQAAAALARRQEHVERFTQKLLAADQVADQLQATIEKADTLFRKVIQLREDARVSWWGTSAHENALSVSRCSPERHRSEGFADARAVSRRCEALRRRQPW